MLPSISETVILFKSVRCWIWVVGVWWKQYTFYTIGFMQHSEELLVNSCQDPQDPPMELESGDLWGQWILNRSINHSAAQSLPISKSGDLWSVQRSWDVEFWATTLSLCGNRGDNMLIVILLRLLLTTDETEEDLVLLNWFSFTQEV